MIDKKIKIYNCKLSGLCGVIENSFGILYSRWQIFHKLIKASINNVKSYTIVSMTLHNFLHQTDNGYSKDSNGWTKPGHLRTGLYMENNCLQDLNVACDSNYSKALLNCKKTWINKIMFDKQDIFLTLKKSFGTVLWNVGCYNMLLIRLWYICTIWATIGTSWVLWLI